MVFKWDPEVGATMQPFLDYGASQPKIPIGDATARRNVFEPMLAQAISQRPFPADLEVKEFSTKASDGHVIQLYWFCKKGGAAATASPGPALLHAHGGGMILGNVKMFTNAIAELAGSADVPILSVEYRLAPEHKHPTLIEDCYAGLIWLREHAAELGVDPARIGVFGESAGGTLAAALALLARDRKLEPPLAKQVLIYPMLDDRNIVPDEKLLPFMLWSYDDNITAWNAILGDGKPGGPDTPHSASPARAKDLVGLPDTYIEVGQLDIFVSEDIEYVARLTRAGVNVEFHLRPGCCHGWESFAGNADVTSRAVQDRVRAIKSF